MLKFFEASVGDFKCQLKKLGVDSCDESKIQLQYSATGCPDKSPTTVAQLLKLIEDFPATLQNINEGKGVPMKVATYLFLSFFCFVFFQMQVIEVCSAVLFPVSLFFSESFLFVNLSRGHE